MAELTEKNIKQYAMIFAEAFKRQGIMSSNTSSLDDNKNVQSDDNFSQYRDQKLREKLLKKNNSLLNEYAKIQKKINSSSGDENTNIEKRNKIEQQLQTDSILLGKAYTSAAEAFKNNKLSEQDLKSFTSNENLSKLSKSFADRMNDAGDEMAGTLIETAEEINTKTQRVLDKMYAKIASGALISRSFFLFLDDFRASLKYGSDETRGVFDSYVQSARMGLSPKDLIEIEAKSKRLVRAMGGADNFEAAMIKGSSSMFQFYGDLEDSTKGTVHALKALASAGITPSISMMVKQNGEFSNMTKMMADTRQMTGQTFAEQNAALDEYIKSDNTKSKLVALSNSAERMALIQRNIANKNYLTTLGLTSESAEKLGEAFNGITGMDPKDRLKESYKAQSVINALGISGAANFAKVMRMGGVDATGVTESMRNNFATTARELSKKQAESHEGQITGQKLVNAKLLQMVPGIKGVIDNAGEIVLAESNKAKIAEERAKRSDTENYALDLKDSATASLLKMTDMASTAVATNGLLTGIAGIASMILISMRGKGVGKMAKNGLGSMVKKAKGLPGRIAGGASSAAANIGSKAASVGKTAAGIGSRAAMVGRTALGAVGGSAGLALGGAGIAAGFGVHQAYKAVTTGKSDVYDALGPGIQSALVDAIEGTVNFFSTDKNANHVQPNTRGRQKQIDKKEQIKTQKKENKMLEVSTNLMEMQRTATELMKQQNEILASNFEKLHVSNSKTLKSSDGIKTALEDTPVELSIPEFSNSYAAS